MKRKFLLTLVGCVLTAYFHLASATIDQILQKSGSNAVMGVAVKDATTGRVIYQHNANRLFLPASSLKIYTAAAALILLGPNFHFPTSVYTDAPSIQPGVLKGNLYVTFSGDPTLTSSDIVEVLETLKKQGITQIQGNVILSFPDYSMAEKYPPNTAERDRIHPYGAPVLPVIIDQNALTFIIHTYGAGQQAEVSLNDPSGALRLSNGLYTKKPGQRCGLSYSLDDNHLLTLKGCVAPRREPYVERISLKDPASNAVGIVKMAIRHWNVNVTGQVIQGSMPMSAKLMNSHASEALPMILSDTLKPSNNVFANALYFKVGQVYWKKTATWQNSGLAVKAILENYAKVPMQSATIVDGAGLSRDNRVSPMQAVELLYSMEQKFALSDDFISALPVPGQKGTMAHRYIAPNHLQKQIHAKTGTVRGVVGLAGYLPSANHHTLIFAFMTNATNPLVFSTDQFSFPAWKYREIENDICRYLMKMNA